MNEVVKHGSFNNGYLPRYLHLDFRYTFMLNCHNSFGNLRVGQLYIEHDTLGTLLTSKQQSKEHCCKL